MSKTQLTSGYDAVSGICWQFRNKGDDWRCKCPAHSVRYPEYVSTTFGRCRSGSRWFWVVGQEHGWADTEELAIAATMVKVRELRVSVGKLVRATLFHGHASYTLKQLNKDKRAARPASSAKDSKPVEYVYAWMARYPVIKRTAKRIYYATIGEDLDATGSPTGDEAHLGRRQGVGYVDRQKFEAGQLPYLFASLQAMLAENDRYRDRPLDLRELKAAMAAAHPDKGGSSAAFIAARKAYVR